MPWWFWILLWVALVALALLMFAFLAVKLFRAFTAVLRELGETGDKLSHLDAGPRADITAEAGHGLSASEPGIDDAVFRPPREARVAYLASKLQRQERRRQRRMERKQRRGQPQALRDLRP